MSDWIPLPHLTALTLKGDDAPAFAHAQFTTAFDGDRGQQWGLSAWCNPKGKVISVMLARSRDAEVDLIAPANQLETLTARLPMYAIGRKVELLAPLPVAGCLSPPEDPTCVLGPDPSRGIRTGQALAPENPEAIARWQALDLCAGIAWLTPARSEQFLPQALGLEERGGLSYHKGCYPGQEVIARVHYLGKAKERLVGFRLAGRVETQDGDLSDENGQRLGRILGTSTGQEATIGLAVAGAQCQPGATIFCGDTAGRLCEPAELC